MRLAERFRFPVITLPGRSYAYRSTAETGAPEPDGQMSREPLPLRGTQPNEISAPASKALIDTEVGHRAGREYLGRTADSLDNGPEPDRIDRETQALNAGSIGRSMGGWPYDGNALFIKHQSIPRKPITVTPFARTIDTGVTVPSSPIGGPLG